MNTRKTVYNKLFTEKVELAKHEVKLTALDDLRKATAEAEESVVAFNKTNKTLIEQAKIALIQEEDFRGATQNMMDLMTPLKKQFADLGLNYLENADVKKAAALLNKNFDISRQAGYIKQIIK